MFHFKKVSIECKIDIQITPNQASLPEKQTHPWKGFDRLTKRLRKMVIGYTRGQLLDWAWPNLGQPAWDWLLEHLQYPEGWLWVIEQISKIVN